MPPNPPPNPPPKPESVIMIFFLNYGILSSKLTRRLSYFKLIHNFFGRLMSFQAQKL